MKGLVAIAAALALAGCATTPQPDLAVDQATPAETVIERSGFTGEIAVSSGQMLPRFAWRSEGGEDAIWPWASVTKQVAATLVMMEVEAGRLDLDAPVSEYYLAATEGAPDQWGDLPAPTLRQLLQHRSGLRDHEALGRIEPTSGMGCIMGRAAPGGDFAYNNCDTKLVGAVLEAVTGKTFGALFADRIAAPLGLRRSGMASASTPLAADDGNAASRLERYGAAGALVGSAEDLLTFGVALMEGRLLSDAARAEMWDGDPALGYAALGQWAFEAPIAGCGGPQRIIERRGSIGDYQARHIILPDRDFVLVAFTPVGEGDFNFGEIWTGEGFTHDLLAATACR